MGSVISVVILFGCFWLVGFDWFSRVMTLLLGLSKAVIWFIEPGELIFPNLGLARLFPLWLLDHCLPCVMSLVDVRSFTGGAIVVTAELFTR